MNVIIFILVVTLMVMIVLVKAFFWNTSPPNNKTKRRNASPPVRHRYEPVGNFGTGDLKTEIHMKWSKPVNTLPVHVDIPRLARKMAIYSDSKKKSVLLAAKDNEVNNGSDGKPIMSAQMQDQHIMRDIILTLSQQVGESFERQKHLETKFAEFFGHGDTSVALRDYMDQVIGESSKVIGILKACNQSVLAPGVLVSTFFCCVSCN
jgi:hypothetical protein